MFRYNKLNQAYVLLFKFIILIFQLIILFKIIKFKF